MSTQPSDNSHYVRRVVLPSGKTIEVVYFDDQPAGGSTPPRAARTEQPTELHVCRGCDSHLVYPVEWDESGMSHWEVRLRCPNCEWTGVGIFEQALVDRFDEELDRGTEALVRDLKRLVHVNMEEDIERFTEALGADHVLPEDF